MTWLHHHPPAASGAAQSFSFRLSEQVLNSWKETPRGFLGLGRTSRLSAGSHSHSTWVWRTCPFTLAKQPWCWGPTALKSDPAGSGEREAPELVMVLPELACWRCLSNWILGQCAGEPLPSESYTVAMLLDHTSLAGSIHPAWKRCPLWTNTGLVLCFVLVGSTGLRPQQVCRLSWKDRRCVGHWDLGGNDQPASPAFPSASVHPFCLVPCW